MISNLNFNFIVCFFMILRQADSLTYFCNYFIFFWFITIQNICLIGYILAYFFFFSFRKSWSLAFYIQKDSAFPIWSNKRILIHFLRKIVIFISRTTIYIFPYKITIFRLFRCFFDDFTDRNLNSTNLFMSFNSIFIPHFNQ